MSFANYRRAREEVDVNLIPVMNLFVTLIPFLLLGAAFFTVGVIPTSLPSQTDESSDIAADLKSVTVNLHMSSDQLQISASSAVLPPEALEALAMTVPRTDKGYDLDLVSMALYAIKREYERSDTVIVLPDEYVQFQDVVMVLDAAREITLNEGTDSEVLEPLFPVVVLSRMVKSDLPAPEES
jgi:biopolymer transport protein ExbD